MSEQTHEEVNWWRWKKLWAGHFKNPTRKDNFLVNKADDQNSPVPSLLNTNLPSTEEEIQLIRNAISVAESKESTSRLQGVISKNHFLLLLYPNPGSASNFTAAHKVILSPIRRIPLEILESIFIASLQNVPDVTWDSNERYPWLDLPWSLCQVSHLWRRTALSLSGLWSRLPSINLGDEHTREPNFLALLAEVLKRSHHAPLDVHFYSSSLFEAPHPAMDLLLPHSPRWRRARFGLPLPALFLFAQLKGSLPSLQKLVVHTWIHGPVISNAAFDFFQDAPNLRKVAIYGSSWARFLLHFTQLEKNLASHRILSSPTLTNLTIIGLHNNGISWPINELPHLIVLRLRFQEWTPARPFLDSLTLPSLEELQLVSDVGVSLSSISSMILRSGYPCRLKKLFLRTRQANNGQLVELLWQIPLITHLNIDLPDIEDIIALTATDNDSAIAPLLQVCEFFVTDPISIDVIRQLNSFAASRCDMPSKYRRADSGELQRLRAIYIDFKTRGISELQQQEFHGWPTATPISGNATTLTQLKQRMTPHIPEVFSMSIPSNSKKIQMFSWEFKAKNVLSSIEALDITQAEEIYISGLHQIMHRLRFWYPQGHSKHKLGESASRILEKWNPIFKSSLADFRWAIKDMNTLMYISQSNPLRSSAQATKITLEIKDPDIAALDLPWPPKSFRL